MTNIKEIIETCAETSKAKGFNTKQAVTQTLLIATEVAEAVEMTTLDANDATMGFAYELLAWAKRFENYRKTASDHEDKSVSAFDAAYLEEHADIIIRVFSHIGGLGMTDLFLTALNAKIEKNKNRPHKHGKQF